MATLQYQGSGTAPNRRVEMRGVSWGHRTPGARALSHPRPRLTWAVTGLPINCRNFWGGGEWRAEARGNAGLLRLCSWRAYKGPGAPRATLPEGRVDVA